MKKADFNLADSSVRCCVCAINRSHVRQRGFTLVEVMVSLAVIAAVLGALVHSAGSNASNAGRLRDRIVANWVAENRLAEMQLLNAFPDIGNKTGKEEVFGNSWHWKTIVQKVEDEDLRRVDIEVRRDEDDKNPLVTLAGFVNHPRLYSQPVGGQ